MHFSVLACAAFVLRAAAQAQTDEFGFIRQPPSGSNLSPMGSTDTSTAQIIAAGRHPNFTSSVTFKPFASGPDWTWRLNFTELPVAVVNKSDTSKRVLFNTQFEFKYPGSETANKTLQQVLMESDVSLSLLVSLVNNLNPSVVTRYKPTDNGNCSNILGSRCLNSYLQALKGPHSPETSQLQYCDDTLHETDSAQGWDVSSSGLGNAKDGTIHPYDTFFYAMTDPYPVGTPTPYQQAHNQLKVVVLKFDSPEMTTKKDPIVLCQVGGTDDAVASKTSNSTASTTPSGSTTSPTKSSSACRTEYGRSIAGTFLAAVGSIYSLL